MTAVVGIVHDNAVWIGGDSAVTDSEDTSLVVCSNPKVFRVGSLVLGVAGARRASRILQYGWTPPKHTRGVRLDRYVAVVVADAIRRALLDHGHSEKLNNQERATFAALIGYRGHLFGMDEEFSVDESAHGFDAVGSGGRVALGVLYATTGQAPRRRIVAALRASEQFDAAVRGPFTILEPAA
jgi:ATP-dependent protease HslVU (ClpYQ) peptidase subunit